MRFALDGIPLAMPKTGVGHYTFELARSLALIDPSDDFTLVFPKAPNSSIAKANNLNNPPNLNYLQLSPGLLNWRWWSVSLPLYLKLRPFDLFHGTNYDLPLWFSRPSVVTIHDLSLLLHPDTHEKRLVRRGRRRLPLMSRAATMIITPTQSVKREVCEHLGIKSSKVVATPLAPRAVFTRLDDERTEATRRRFGIRDDFILFAGTIEPRKNLRTLVRAFQEILLTTELKPQLVIAGGEGWLMQDFFGFIRQAGLENDVCFTGYLDDEELRALYSSCAVFVYPSLYEGFGLPPLEAMACGAPVVASDIAPIVETAGQAARLVNPTQIHQLAAALIDLLQNRQARERLSAAGLQRVKEFSWQQTAQRTREVYQEAFRRHSQQEMTASS